MVLRFDELRIPHRQPHKSECALARCPSADGDSDKLCTLMSYGDQPPEGVLGLPVYAIKNTAKRWLTTVNYDLLIYDDKIVIARGISWKSTPREVAQRRSLGLSARETDEARVHQAAFSSGERLRESDASNRLIPAAAVLGATLVRGSILSRLELELGGGERMRFMWLRWSRNADYAEARQALSGLLGAKLRAD
jgi:hypothetical protein